MADLITHGLCSAGLAGCVASALTGGDMAITAATMAAEFIDGAWPDASDAAVAAMHRSWGPAEGVEPWPLIFGLKVRMHAPTYLKYHEQYHGKWWSFLPGVALHVRATDPPFHRKPKSVSQADWDSNANGVRNWFKRLWWLWLLWMILGAGLTTLAILSAS